MEQGERSNQWLVPGIVFAILMLVGLFAVGGAVWYWGSGMYERQRAEQQTPSRQESAARQLPQAMPGMAGAPAVVNPPLALRLYEKFDGSVGSAAAGAVSFAGGWRGQAVNVRPADAMSVPVWPEFSQAATVMAWVSVPARTGRFAFWWGDERYPSAFYYPDQSVRLAMQFAGPQGGATTQVLAMDMQPGRFYHLAQSWGADGYCVFLDGRCLGRWPQQNAGVLPGRGRLLLGDYAYRQQAPAAGAFNQAGILLDELAVFAGQVPETAVADIARGILTPDAVVAPGAEE